MAGSECRALLTALASCLSLDIAAIEARHASNREISLMRAKGWFPSLYMLAAGFVNHTVAMITQLFAHIHQMTMCPNAERSSADNQDEDKKRSKTKQRVRRRNVPKRGGGGAWRAFVHDKLRGVAKLDGKSASALAAEYKSLSPDDKAFYAKAGKAASLAHRSGWSSFAAAEATPVAQAALQQDVGEQTTSGAIVGIDPATMLQVSLQYQGLESFRTRYSHAKTEIKRYWETCDRNSQHSEDIALVGSHEETSVLSKDQQTQLQNFHAEAGGDAFVATVGKQHSSFAGGFAKVGGNEHEPVVSFYWVAPIQAFLQAQWHRRKVLLKVVSTSCRLYCIVWFVLLIVMSLFIT